VLVAGGQAIAPGPPAQPPKDIADGCVRLAELNGLGVAGFQFTVTPEEGWRLAGASPQPEMRAGGEPFLDALSRALEEARA
jgi:hypothetical protein